jgi:hypothetical protein
LLRVTAAPGRDRHDARVVCGDVLDIRFAGSKFTPDESAGGIVQLMLQLFSESRQVNKMALQEVVWVN